MIGLLSAPLLFGHQNPPGPGGPEPGGPQRTMTLTGCLAKGDSAEEYQLTTHKGETWTLRGKEEKLGTQVGHTVKVTGKTAAAKDASAYPGEHAHLHVTDVTMVSDSCKK